MNIFPGLPVEVPSSVYAAEEAVDYACFDVSLAGSSSVNLQVPFSVGRSEEVTIECVTKGYGERLGRYENIPLTGMTGAIYIIPNAADNTQDQEISYDNSNNVLTVSTGVATTFNGVVSITKHRRIVKNSSLLVDPGVDTESPLPFAISDFNKVYLGSICDGEMSGRFLRYPLSAAATLSWHGECYNGQYRRIKVTSKTTWMRDTVAIPGNQFYLIEFA